jgi:glutathione synthase
MTRKDFNLVRLLIILDPIEQLKPAKDTSLMMMREAQQRGHAVFIASGQDLFLQDAQVRVMAKSFHFTEGSAWFEIGLEFEASPSEFDAVLMRKDPPFDDTFLYATYLLDLAAQQGAYVVNNPQTLRDWNEKLSISYFPQFTPPFVVSARADILRSFLESQIDIVFKPLDGMGGSQIFRVKLDDPNISVILETLTQHGRRKIMAQRYIPEILAGDKRILIINGQPAPYALARIPMAGETRGNLAAGGRGVAQPLSKRDKEIASTVGETLKQKGLFLVGLDVIGDYLTEINVTSPTGMVEIAAQTDCNLASIFMDALTQSIQARHA